MAASQPANPGRNNQNQPQGPGERFESFFDTAVREQGRAGAATPSVADLEPRQLLRYASGRSGDDDRAIFEGYVSRSSWAYDRVVALVKSGRPTASPLARALGKRLLDGNESPAHVAIAGAVLEVEGTNGTSFEDTLRTTTNPKTRAACLIGLGRTNDARKDLENAKNDAVVALLRRMSHDDEANLIALLDAFPSML